MKRLLLATALTLGLISITGATKTLAADFADCDDFTNQREAQLFYIDNMIKVNQGILDDYYKTLGYTSQDIKNLIRKDYDRGILDGDNDGIACEHLPGEVSFINKARWEIFIYNFKFFRNLGLKELTVFFNTKPVFNNATDARFYSNTNIGDYIRVATYNNGRSLASIRSNF